MGVDVPSRSRSQSNRPVCLDIFQSVLLPIDGNGRKKHVPVVSTLVESPSAPVPPLTGGQGRVGTSEHGHLPVWTVCAVSGREEAGTTWAAGGAGRRVSPTTGERLPVPSRRPDVGKPSCPMVKGHLRAVHGTENLGVHSTCFGHRSSPCLSRTETTVRARVPIALVCVCSPGCRFVEGRCWAPAAAAPPSPPPRLPPPGLSTLPWASGCFPKPKVPPPPAPLPRSRLPHFREAPRQSSGSEQLLAKHLCDDSACISPEAGNGALRRHRMKPRDSPNKTPAVRERGLAHPCVF